MSKKFKTLDLKPLDEWAPLPWNHRPLKPMGSLVHVQLDRSPDVIDLGPDRDPIILSGSSKAQCEVCQAKVLSIGPKVQREIEVGQTVLIRQHHGSGNDGRVRKDETMLIEEKFVLCIVES